MKDKHAEFRTGKVKDYHHYNNRECGQGYEDEQCVNCTWVMGLPLGVIACGKGMIDSKSGIMFLGEK